MSLRIRLVVPAFNEETRLDLASFDKFLATAPDVGILFVDDGSKDGTAKLLQSLIRRYPLQAELLSRRENGGKGEAIRVGVLEAIAQGAEVVGYLDADLAAPLPEALRLVRLIEAGDRDVIIGSRVRLLGRGIERSFSRHYLGRVFATLASMTLSLPVYDTQCGLKVFNVSPAVGRVFSRPFCSRWLFDVELIGRLSLATKPTLGLREEPLERWQDVSGSRLRLRDFMRAPFELVRIRAALDSWP